MSAVPQKKLCWNCEGNVSKDIDNCPYCGVYLHAIEENDENTSFWSPSYSPSSATDDDVSSPLYTIKNEIEPHIEQKENSTYQKLNRTQANAWSAILIHLKKEIFPILFLMMGSIFFLFGVVLLLFSHNGTLTLQWQASNSIYFLILSIPLIIFGWIFFQKLEIEE